MVEIGVRNFLVVGLLAILFIVLFKVVFTKYQVKGVSELIQAV